MKKIAIAMLVTALLLLGTVATAFAAEQVVSDMTFGGNAVQLSLDQAVQIMQTKGRRAESATLNKKADEAVAKGYEESADSISKLLKKLDAMVDGNMITSIQADSLAEQNQATEVNQKIMKLRRDFAQGQIDANYRAEMNQIRIDTVELYYGVLQAEENLRVAKENLANQKTISTNTQKKYRAGAVARFDTYTAETAVMTAEKDVASAQTALNSAKMNFNMLLGYDLMQQVNLTDKLELVGRPQGSLARFIEKAKANRNEIKAPIFAADIQEILLNNLKYRYPENSATYLSQLNAYQQAKKMVTDAPIQIEMDVRIKYMQLADKRREVEVAKIVLANAEEGYRLASITFDVGMNTVADVQEAQIRVYRAGQGLTKAITDYDLAVYDFTNAIGVGTTRIPL